MLSEDKMRRLAFVRYLYGLGVEQSRRPEPLAAASILTFHDSIELFLQLAAEHLNVSKKRIEFEEYWTLIESALQGKRLAERESMRRLNKLRVNLKHDGTFPAPLSIEGFRSNVTGFFEVNTPIVFDTEFGDISMAHIIRYPDVRSNLREADRSMMASQYDAALGHIARAFWQVIQEFERWEVANFGRPLFMFREPLVTPKPPPEPEPAPAQQLFEHGDLLALTVGLDVANLRVEVNDRLLTVEDMLRAQVLGLDVRGYVRFRLLTSKFLDISNFMPKPNLAPSSEVCQACYDFVIDSALRLQELDTEAQ